MKARKALKAKKGPRAGETAAVVLGLNFGEDEFYFDLAEHRGWQWALQREGHLNIEDDEVGFIEDDSAAPIVLDDVEPVDEDTEATGAGESAPASVAVADESDEGESGPQTSSYSGESDEDEDARCTCQRCIWEESEDPVGVDEPDESSGVDCDLEYDWEALFSLPVTPASTSTTVPPASPHRPTTFVPRSPEYYARLRAEAGEESPDDTFWPTS